MRRKRKLKRSLKTELVFCPYPTITSVSSRNSKRCSQKHLSHTEWPSNLPWNTSDQKTASSKTLTRPTWRPRTKSSKECQELKKSKLDKRCKAKVGEPYQLLERGQVAIIMSNLEVNNLANLRLTLWLIQELQLIPRLIWNLMPKEVFRPRETHSWRIGKEKPSLGLRFRKGSLWVNIMPRWGDRMRQVLCLKVAVVSIILMSSSNRLTWFNRTHLLQIEDHVK